jgi:hypothetical protein
MARLCVMPNPSRAVSADSCSHRRRNGLPDETLAKDNEKVSYRGRSRY